MGIGMVFQHFSLFEALTVADNVALGMNKEAVGRDLDKQIIEVSEAYGLTLDPTRYISSLSVGERQRVEIIRCLLQNPRLLIMDEPTNHLDILSKNVLKEALKKFEGTLILVSHDRDFVQGLCEKVVSFKDREVKPFLGDINAYLEYQKLSSLKELEKKSKPVSQTKSTTEEDSYEKQKEQRGAQQKVAKLEKQIARLEKEIKDKNRYQSFYGYSRRGSLRT